MPCRGLHDSPGCAEMPGANGARINSRQAILPETGYIA